jgi:tRNA G18 (ribose-2'-O)-methylase SpoU
MAFIMSSRFKVQSSKFKNPKSKVQSPKSKVYKDRKPKTENRRPKNSALSTQHSALLYGVLPVTEALRAGNRRIEKILIAEGAREKRLSEIWNLARQNGVQIQKTPRENLSKYTEEGTNHQGVVALVAAADYADADKLLTEIAAKENSLTLILDGVEDP